MSPKLLKILKSSFNVVAVIAVIAIWGAVSYFVISVAMGVFSPEEDMVTNDTAAPVADNTEEDCSVLGINLHGKIVTYHTPESYIDGNLAVDETSADDVFWVVKKANEDEKVKYILAEVDSSGGSPVAGLEMMSAFKHSTKPVIVFTRTSAASAAYLAATGAQTIFASPASDIGSIGVTASYVDNVKKNAKDGLTFVDLSAGKYKDSFSPDRILTNEEKQVIMRDVNLLYEMFIKTVSENRKLDINKVRQMADGATMLGAAALTNGLVDKLGDIYDVQNYLKEKIGAEPNICWQN